MYIETKLTHYISAHQLCDFLTEKMGKTVDFTSSPNDTSYSVDVDVERLDQEDLDEFLNSGEIDLDCGSFDIAMNYAALKGWIAPGSYVITVSW